MGELTDIPSKDKAAVVIVGRSIKLPKGHAHAGERGIVTSEVIESTGQLVVELQNCEHGTERSAVTLEEIEKGSGNTLSPAFSVKKAPKFTPKESKFLKTYVEEVLPGKINPETGKKTTKQDVAMRVYDAKTPATASAIASENLNKPKFKDALAAAFAEAEITPQSLAETMRDAMSATKTATFQGEVYTSTEPDHGIRVSAARAAASLMAAADDDSKNPTPNVFNFNTGTQNFINKPEIKT